MDKEKYDELPGWLKTNVFYRSNLTPDSDNFEFGRDHVRVHPLDANLISSESGEGCHNLFLDLDIEHYYVPSTNEGHGHLYVNVCLSDEALREVVEVLVRHGILQKGIRDQVEDRGALTLRPPGVEKGTIADLGIDSLDPKPYTFE